MLRLNALMVWGEWYDCGTIVQHPQVLRSEEHTSELQSRLHLVCRLLLEKKKEHWDVRRACSVDRSCHLGPHCRHQCELNVCSRRGWLLRRYRTTSSALVTPPVLSRVRGC